MTRLYRALLYLYPRAFRHEYGNELCRTFAERTRHLSAPAQLSAAITDVVPNAVGAHWDNIRALLPGGPGRSSFGMDVRLALRQIRRTPLFSGVLIAVIALGIGINTGLLTTLSAYAWRPAPGISSDSRLARLTVSAVRSDELSWPDLQDLRAAREVFAEVAAWGPASLPTDFGAGAEEVDVSYTTANFFRLLGVTMAAGTGFTDGADQSAEPVVVIGYSLWMSRFGGSADAVGRTIRVMNQPFRIIGVAPERFVGVDALRMGEPGIWLPLGVRPVLEPNTRDDLRRREAVFLESVARLAPGVSAGAVTRLTAALSARFAQEEPESHERFALHAERLTGMEQGDGGTRELVIAFLLVAALVAVVTCTNVSALLLGRAVSRRREIGVRLAIGAGRLRILRQMLTEALVLAAAGAALGLALYAVVVKIAYATIPELIYGLEPTPRTFLYAAVCALVATVTFGLAPALHASRADINQVIKNSGTSQVRRSRLQATFVVIQLACSMPALVVTSLVLVDMRRGMNDAAELAPASVLTMYSEVAGHTGTLDTYRRVRDRLTAMPGVQSVAVSVGPIVIGGGNGLIFGIGYGESFEGAGARSPGPRIGQIHVTPDYFETLGIPILRGRAIGAEEDHAGSVAVVIEEELANRLWPGGDAIGRTLVRRSGGDEQSPATATELTVIGVAGNAPYDQDTRSPRVFVPLATADSARGVRIAVQTRGDAAPFVIPIRAALREVEPLATAGNASTLAQQYAGRKREAVQSNLAAFAVGMAALLLASLGLYAIIAFAVAQRTREIGIRLAVGATSKAVVGHFFRGGLKVTAIGLAIGLPVTVAGIKLVEANMVGFTPRKVLAVLLVVPVLIVIAGLASWLPARRAGRVDPLIALRSE